ncbi:MAG: hypothetical protein DWQ35_16280 [Planctomycetota bacterium]|nr:MAG: hypothetical protein DWQ35_16280 [Planctomycetota bacterium]
MNHEALHADHHRLVVPADVAPRNLTQAKLWRMVGTDEEMPMRRSPYDEEPLNEREAAPIRSWLLAGAGAG